jgi:hypothetical protein
MFYILYDINWFGTVYAFHEVLCARITFVVLYGLQKLFFIWYFLLLDQIYLLLKPIIFGKAIFSTLQEN